MSVRPIIDVKGEVVPIEIQNHEQDMSAPSEINSSAPEPSFGFGVTGQRFAPLDGAYYKRWGDMLSSYSISLYLLYIPL
jgi:hypothetical protein